jgi:cyclopropane fatty-acyl-phospholipid synthase-like methyltransferase
MSDAEMSDDRRRFETYADFRERAKDPRLSLNQKCGFSETVRAGQATAIFADIREKLAAFDQPRARILDIGAGCSELTHHIIEATAARGQSLTLIDSPEMLELLPSRPHLGKIEGPFPDCLDSGFREPPLFDAILCYSVAQHIFAEANLPAFLDAAARLLAEQGRLLVGDIPNADMRKRFMASKTGAAFHRANYPHLPAPTVRFNTQNPGQIDDGVVLGLLMRMRQAGFQAFIVPQAAALPMANRREDMLIIRP